MENVKNRKSSKSKLKPEERNQISIEKLIELKKIRREAGDGESLPETVEKLENKENNIKSRIDKLICDKPDKEYNESRLLQINFELDGISFSLFLISLIMHLYKLQEPKNIVFDELHYGKYVSMYMQNTFYFASNPPLGIQLITLMAYLFGYDGKFKFDMIGRAYSQNVPIFALRFIPAIFGSFLIPVSYHLLLAVGLSQWTAILGALLILFDNSFLTQSRFILMEPMLISFSAFGLFCFLRFFKYQLKPYCFHWWFWLVLGTSSLACSICIKYVGFYSYCLGLMLILVNFSKILQYKIFSDLHLFTRFLIQMIIVIGGAFAIYVGVFYVHLTILYKAGPHDNVMTSAFQASLEGGLASITKGQPLVVAHGSQITLRHSHGRTCWLHSHPHVYPIRYPDGRGSSHQQQVTCYSFKDVNNWWIVKRPDKNDLVVEKPVDPIKHGDVIQLVHGNFEFNNIGNGDGTSKSSLTIFPSHNFSRIIK